MMATCRDERIAQSKADALKILEYILTIRGYQSKFLIDHENQGSIGWSFYLPPAFREALDIRYMERKNQETELECMAWQQGSSFAFDRGHMIYDTQQAYTLPWAEALEKIEVCLQVTEASPVTPEEKKVYITKIDSAAQKLERDRQKAVYAALEIKTIPYPEARVIAHHHTGKYASLGIFKTMAKLGAFEIQEDIKPRTSGFIRYDVYRPNDKNTGLLKSESRTCSQDEFVRLLIAGIDEMV